MTSKVRIIYFDNETDDNATTAIVTSGPEEYQDVKHDVLGLIEEALKNLPENASVLTIVFDSNPQVYPLR